MFCFWRLYLQPGRIASSSLLEVFFVLGGGGEVAPLLAVSINV